MASKKTATPEKRRAIAGASTSSKALARAEAALDALDEPGAVVSVVVRAPAGSSFSISVDASDVRAALLRVYEDTAADFDDAVEQV